MTVENILELLQSVAPFETQEEWDNSGLLVGSPRQEVASVLFALDATERVIDEAAALGASLIVTHHPLMLHGRRRLTDEDYEGRIVSRLIRENISLIAAHTNLDQAAGGINDMLCALCGLDGGAGEGFFRCGTLAEPVPAETFAWMLEDSLGDSVRLMGPKDTMIRRVGLCSGGGSEFWEAAEKAGCDAFIAGEIRHHHALAMADAGIVAFECGHFATEEPGIRALAEALQNCLNEVEWNVRVFVSNVPAYAFPKET